MSLAPVLLKLLAILCVIAIGYVVQRARWLGEGDVGRTLGNVAYYIFVPALLFRTTCRLDFATMPWDTLVAFFVPVVALMLGVYGVLRWRRRPDEPVAAPCVRSISACFGNSVQMGIPMAAAMFGEAGLSIHVAIVSLHALTLLTVLTALVELDLARDRVRQGQAEAHVGHMLLTTVRNTVIHPVVLPILLGLAWNAGGLGLPGLVDETLLQLGQAVVPMCLVLIGMSLAYHGFQGTLKGALVLSALKLVLLPAAVLVAGHWGFGLTGLPLAVIVMCAALPVGNNALIFSQRYHALEAEATATVVLSTFLFAVTAPLWLWALSRLG
jgi:malonate transporter